jgi:hypothetical protein
MTLEARLQGAWRLLRTEGAAACPACGGEMTLRAEIGECGDCGAHMR